MSKNCWTLVCRLPQYLLEAWKEMTLATTHCIAIETEMVRTLNGLELNTMTPVT